MAHSSTLDSIYDKRLRSLVGLAPGIKAKIRNQLNALFSHTIQRELFFPRAGINLIANVRQGAKRQRELDTLTLSEIREILSGIKPQAIKVMVIHGYLGLPKNP